MTLEKRGPISTGIDILDRKIGGGIPVGTVTALSASPASQSELFLYELAATRRTVYLSTLRTEDAVAAVLDDRDIDLDTIEVFRIDEGDPIGTAEQALDELSEETNMIVDPVDVLESSDSTSYRWFLAELNQHVTGTTNTAVLHCLDDDVTPGQRRNTIHFADIVLQLSTEVSGDGIENRLTVPKFRTGQSVEEVIKLDMTSEVEVDLSRNIL